MVVEMNLELLEYCGTYFTKSSTAETTFGILSQHIIPQRSKIFGLSTSITIQSLRFARFSPHMALIYVMVQVALGLAVEENAEHASVPAAE